MFLLGKATPSSVAGRQLNGEVWETYDTCYPAQRPTNGLEVVVSARHGTTVTDDHTVNMASLGALATPVEKSDYGNVIPLHGG
jgi:hypothetical protein